MLRVVALRKAVVAGVAAAFAWEAALRLLALAGLPTFDIVRELGTLVFSDERTLAWWTAGTTAHALVGAAWALFYAYFFWARWRWPPALQGLTFAALPALLATIIVFPQLELMHLDQRIVQLHLPTIFDGLTGAKLAGLMLGHAIFGVTVGALYTHPVGYATQRQPRRAPPVRHWRRRSAEDSRRPTGSFIFATGIECSYPTIEHGRWRRDQLAATDHYRRWREDFDRAREIGVSHIRYGPPLQLIFRGPGQFDWTWIDGPMAEMQARGPEPIIDLCHFGVPAWLGDFQNDELPDALAEYAGAFARRFPWVRFYTPVNEMYVCARASALDGMWNEERRDEGAFVRAVLNLANASVAMTDAILNERPDAVFVNSESSEFNQPCCPDPEIERIASFENERRFLPLDLIYAHALSPEMRDFLRSHGVEGDALDRFAGREVPRRSILGLDYYEWNERLIDHDRTPRALGELFGWYVIANQYYQRYQRPLMHTETNRVDASDAPRWLWRQWHNVQLLRRSGAPLVGFTWYSLTDQVDWGEGLTAALGITYPVGLLDLNRDPRPVGLSYKHLIDMHAGGSEYRECKPLVELLR